MRKLPSSVSLVSTDSASTAKRRSRGRRHVIRVHRDFLKVQASDGCFFERLSGSLLENTAGHGELNERGESREVDDAEPAMRIVGLSVEDHQQFKDLYLEALYTIMHRVGKAPAAIPEEHLLTYAKEAFQIDDRLHQVLMDRAKREKPPVILLNCVLMEARDLIAKDINGFSDPFVMLGVMPGTKRRKLPAQPSQSDSVNAEGDYDTPPMTPPANNNYKGSSGSGAGAMLQRFGGSFRRKFDRGSRKGLREDDSRGIPAKLIKASSVQYKTLNPKWYEKFQFIVDDVQSDKLHLDIWDHDDEERSVLDAVSMLNQVQGLKGLGRYFKEVAQSARAGSNELVDDFLGSITLKLKDIPSSGLEDWFVLERRSEKSEVSGAVMLKLWLSTREERFGANSEDDLDVKQHIELVRQFTLYEIRNSKASVHSYTGSLPEAASAILHQHAIQGDLTEVHQAMCKWLAYSEMINIGISYGFLHDALLELITSWRRLALDKEEENMLALSFEKFNAISRRLIIDHQRCLANTARRQDMDSFRDMLRCLSLLRQSSLYEKCVPFGKPLRSDIADALKESSNSHFTDLEKGRLADEQQKRKGISMENEENPCEEFYRMLKGLNRACSKIAQFDPIFSSTVGVDYHANTYQEFDVLLYEWLSSELMSEKEGSLKRALLANSDDEEDIVSIIRIHLEMNEFINFARPKQKYKMGTLNWSSTFDRAISKWIDLAKHRAFSRVELSMQLDAQIQITSNEIRHTSSHIDMCHIIEQILWIWEHVSITDVELRVELTEKLVQCICKLVEYYVDRTLSQLAADGFCGQLQPVLPPALVNIVAAAINNIEMVRRSVSGIADRLRLDELGELYKRKTKKEAKWRKGLETELDNCDTSMSDQIDSVAELMVKRQTAQLKKHIFHLAWSPSACTLEQSLKPLITMLDSELSSVHKTLLHRNFLRIMQCEVNLLLQLFQECIDDNPGLEPTFYQRLSEAWSIISDFFHAEGKGLSLETLQNIPAHRVLLSELTLNAYTTVQLIESFYKEMIKEQNEASECKYGILNVRAYYRLQTLVVDVIGAKQIPALDSNGLSDPFVVVELVPRLRYPNQPIVKTKVVPKTLNPIYDETFEFHIPPKLPPSANIHFIVMDHDFLRSNDFAGEAFLELGEVPGFASAQQASTGPTTLRQFNLVLIHPTKKAQEGTLRVLSSRKEDKEAIDFISKLTISY